MALLASGNNDTPPKTSQVSSRIKSFTLFLEQSKPCSSSRFTFVGLRQVFRYCVVCSATFTCFHCSLCLAFSLHFPSHSIFRQSSQLSCGLPLFLESCIFFPDLLGNLSSFILIMSWPRHFPALTYFANYASLSSNFFSCLFNSSSLHSLYIGYCPEQSNQRQSMTQQPNISIR